MNCKIKQKRFVCRKTRGNVATSQCRRLPHVWCKLSVISFSLGKRKLTLMKTLHKKQEKFTVWAQEKKFHVCTGTTVRVGANRKTSVVCRSAGWRGELRNGTIKSQKQFSWRIRKPNINFLLYGISCYHGGTQQMAFFLPSSAPCETHRSLYCI